MLFNEVFAKLFKELGVPLNDGFLLVTTVSLHIIILLLKSFEDVFELVLVSQYRDDCSKKAAIDVLDQLLASLVVDLSGVFEPQYGRNDVWELVLVHFPQQLTHVPIQVLPLAS